MRDEMRKNMFKIAKFFAYGGLSKESNKFNTYFVQVTNFIEPKYKNTFSQSLLCAVLEIYSVSKSKFNKPDEQYLNRLLEIAHQFIECETVWASKSERSNKLLYFYQQVYEMNKEFVADKMKKIIEDKLWTVTGESRFQKLFRDMDSDSFDSQYSMENLSSLIVQLIRSEDISIEDLRGQLKDIRNAVGYSSERQNLLSIFINRLIFYFCLFEDGKIKQNLYDLDIKDLTMYLYDHIGILEKRSRFVEGLSSQVLSSYLAMGRIYSESDNKNQYAKCKKRLQRYLNTLNYGELEDLESSYLRHVGYDMDEELYSLFSELVD